MITRAEALLKYFTDGTADSDREILQSVFVKTTFFKTLLDFSPTAPTLLIGAKGTGKSAVYDFLHSSFISSGVRCLYIRPEDISIDWGTEQSSGYLIHKAKDCLARTIAAQIGTHLPSGLSSEHENILRELAKSSYDCPPDIVQRLVYGLNTLATSVAHIDFSDFLQKADPNCNTIINAIEKAVQGDKFFLFIDDTDRITTPDLDGLNRIWAFILATRALMRDIPSLRIAISLRSEIWNRLREDCKGQQDQIDHFRDHVIHISVSHEEIEKIVELRFILAARKLSYDNYISAFFEKEYCLVDGKNMRRPWLEFIARRSRLRPRDAIQMIHRWAILLRDNDNSHIDDNIVQASMIPYSSERIDDLLRENQQECPSLKAIIDRFACSPGNMGMYTYSPEELNTLLKKTISGKVILYKKSLSSNNIFELWKFLYQIGFISARYNTNDPQTKENKPYTHITFHDNPDFLRNYNWNFIQKYAWQIHPAYTDYLISKKNESKNYAGIGTIKNR